MLRYGGAVTMMFLVERMTGVLSGPVTNPLLSTPLTIRTKIVQF